jgi:hypothetical protein
MKRNSLDASDTFRSAFVSYEEEEKKTKNEMGIIN